MIEKRRNRLRRTPSLHTTRQLQQRVEELSYVESQCRRVALLFLCLEATKQLKRRVVYLPGSNSSTKLSIEGSEKEGCVTSGTGLSYQRLSLVCCVAKQIIDLGRSFITDIRPAHKRHKCVLIQRESLRRNFRGQQRRQIPLLKANRLLPRYHTSSDLGTFLLSILSLPTLAI